MKEVKHVLEQDIPHVYQLYPRPNPQPKCTPQHPQAGQWVSPKDPTHHHQGWKRHRPQELAPDREAEKAKCPGTIPH